MPPAITNVACVNCARATTFCIGGDLCRRSEEMEVAQKLHFDACDIQDEELNISCRTNSSGCDVDDILDSSGEDLGCSPTLQPRKLFANTMDCSDSENNQSMPLNNNKTPMVNMTG